jgi:hypothetical protein
MRVEMRVVADPELPFAKINAISPDSQGKGSLVVENLAPGDYEFRGTVVDVDGRESSPPNEASASIVEPIENPSPAVSFTATVE